MSTKSAKQTRDLLEPVMASVALAGVAMTLGAFALGSARTGLSVTAGAVLGLGNLWVISAIVRALMSGESPKKASAIGWGLLATFKMTLLFASAFILLRRGWVDGISLAFGYGTLPIGIFVGTLWSSLSNDARRP